MQVQRVELSWPGDQPWPADIQKGMGVHLKPHRHRLKTSPVLPLVCPSGFYGINQEKLFGLQPAPCRPCLANQITHGHGSRASSYIDGSGQTVVITEGGYFSSAACVNLPGYGYSSFGVQPCDKGELHCRRRQRDPLCTVSFSSTAEITAEKLHC